MPAIRVTSLLPLHLWTSLLHDMLDEMAATFGVSFNVSMDTGCSFDVEDSFSEPFGRYPVRDPDSSFVSSGGRADDVARLDGSMVCNLTRTSRNRHLLQVDEAAAVEGGVASVVSQDTRLDCAMSKKLVLVSKPSYCTSLSDDCSRISDVPSSGRHTTSVEVRDEEDFKSVELVASVDAPDEVMAIGCDALASPSLGFGLDRDGLVRPSEPESVETGGRAAFADVAPVVDKLANTLPVRCSVMVGSSATNSNVKTAPVRADGMCTSPNHDRTPVRLLAGLVVSATPTSRSPDSAIEVVSAPVPSYSEGEFRLLDGTSALSVKKIEPFKNTMIINEIPSAQLNGRVVNDAPALPDLPNFELNILEDLLSELDSSEESVSSIDEKNDEEKASGSPRRLGSASRSHELGSQAETTSSSDDESSEAKRKAKKKERKAAKRMRQAMKGIDLKPPCVWDGKPELEAFNHWKYEVDTWRELNGLDDRLMIQIVVNFMSGQARTFFMTHVAPTSSEWSMEKLYDELFTYCFPPDFKRRLREKLMAASQGNSDVRDFVRKLRVELIGEGLDTDKNCLDDLVARAMCLERRKMAYESEKSRRRSERVPSQNKAATRKAL